ncbi:MAG: HNH endonuclease signature motif containing protein [Bacteroidia bacterium]
MNYKSIYEKLISSKQKLNRVKYKGFYYEKHHILPRCLGGTNDKNNLILLTAKEHFIAHLLLTKIYEGKDKRKMYFAFWRMCNTKDGYIPTSSQYENGRKLLSIAFSEERKSKKGIKLNLSDEQRKKLHERRLGKKHTAESIKKMQLVQKGKIISIEQRKKISEAKTGQNHSLESKEKISAAHKGKKISEETKKKTSSSVSKSWETRKRTWIISKPVKIFCCENCNKNIKGAGNYSQHFKKCENLIK